MVEVDKLWAVVNKKVAYIGLIAILVLPLGIPLPNSVAGVTNYSQMEQARSDGASRTLLLPSKEQLAQIAGQINQEQLRAQIVSLFQRAPIDEEMLLRLIQTELTLPELAKALTLQSPQATWRLLAKVGLSESVINQVCRATEQPERGIGVAYLLIDGAPGKRLLFGQDELLAKRNLIDAFQQAIAVGCVHSYLSGGNGQYQ